MLCVSMIDLGWTGKNGQKKDLHLGLILAAGISRLGVLAQRRGAIVTIFSSFFPFFYLFRGRGKGGPRSLVSHCQCQSINSNININVAEKNAFFWAFCLAAYFRLGRYIWTHDSM